MSLPLVEEIRPAPDPVEACARFVGAAHVTFLDSVSGFGRLGAHSFLCADPFLVIRSKGRVLEQVGPRGAERALGDPFETLRARLREFPAETLRDLPPFQGGAAGYFGYDLAHHVERLPSPTFDDLALPDLDVGFHDWVLAWDHAADRCWLISNGRPETDR
ncbi:MAG: aminodeoxychorismate synthase component I, partial [Gemmatimonadota bacterium]